MERVLFTVHARPGRPHVEVVGEPDWLAAIPPVWALWNGLWITLLLQLAAFAAVAVLAPLLLGPVALAMAVMTRLDGNAFWRAELRLRGWREVGTVLATTPEGAEELYLAGRSE